MCRSNAKFHSRFHSAFQTSSWRGHLWAVNTWAFTVIVIVCPSSGTHKTDLGGFSAVYRTPLLLLTQLIVNKGTYDMIFGYTCVYVWLEIKIRNRFSEIWDICLPTFLFWTRIFAGNLKNATSENFHIVKRAITFAQGCTFMEHCIVI